MLAIAAAVLNGSDFAEVFIPLRQVRGEAVSAMLLSSLFSMILGLWGIMAFKVESKPYIYIYGGGVLLLSVFIAGQAAIYSSMT